MAFEVYRTGAKVDDRNHRDEFGALSIGALSNNRKQRKKLQNEL